MLKFLTRWWTPELLCWIPCLEPNVLARIDHVLCESQQVLTEWCNTVTARVHPLTRTHWTHFVTSWVTTHCQLNSSILLSATLSPAMSNPCVLWHRERYPSYDRFDSRLGISLPFSRTWMWVNVSSVMLMSTNSMLTSTIVNVDHPQLVAFCIVFPWKYFAYKLYLDSSTVCMIVVL